MYGRFGIGLQQQRSSRGKRHGHGTQIADKSPQGGVRKRLQFGCVAHWHASRMRGLAETLATRG